MLASVDAVGEGFVASLARPGQNVTGLTLLAGPEIASKQLELLREIAPSATRVAARSILLTARTLRLRRN